MDFWQTEASRALLSRVSHINQPTVRQSTDGEEPADSTEDGDGSESDATDEVDAEIESLSLEEQHKNALKDFYYFNRGFKGDELATNFTACGNRTAYWYYYELATIQVKLLYSTA